MAYSISAVVSAVGENKLMPGDPDCKCKVINGKSGYVIDNSSWILGRIMRDFHIWSDAATKQKTAEILNKKWIELKVQDSGAKRPTRAGLIVSMYKPSTDRLAGVPKRDFVYWSGIFTIAFQLGIATIPCGLFGDWSILMITASGICLALATGLLPQWKKEKWACRTQSNDTYVLTRGNGAQHAIVILGNGNGLNLEDLAAGQNNMDSSANIFTRVAVLGLSSLWILLLTTAAGLKKNTWFLIAVGGIGILQNVLAAGWARRPENFGIPLHFVNVFGHERVMKTLLEIEKEYPGLGKSLLAEFFPGRLRDDEIEAWKQVEQKAKQGNHDTSVSVAESGEAPLGEKSTATTPVRIEGISVQEPRS